MFKGFRIIIIPEGHAKSPRQFFLSQKVVRLVVFAAVLFVVAFALSIIFISKYSVLSYRFNMLKSENKMLREENTKVVALKKKVEELRDFRRRISFLLGVEEDTADLKNIFLPQRESDSSSTLLTKKISQVSPYVPSGMPTEGIFSQGFSLFHPAVDIVAPYHAPVLATANGIVKEAGWDSILGNYIVLKHGDEYKTVYGHLSRITVTKGRFIKRGDLLGFVGNTGRSTGPHLHYEVWKNGKRVDPRRFINLSYRSSG